MGQFIFTPPGVHDRLIEAAGFTELEVEDVAGALAAGGAGGGGGGGVRRDYLLTIESEIEFEDLQRMLSAAYTLSSERRLSRFAYRARKPAE
jgi:hypothetical protein